MEVNQNIIFEDKCSRSKFIRNVYLIIMLQLITAAGIIAPMIFFEDAKKHISENNEYLTFTGIIFSIFFMVMIYNEDVRRRNPCNIIFIVLYTIITGLFLGVISTHLTEAQIFISICCLIFIFLSLTLFASQHWIDFTTSIGIIIIGFIIVFAITGTIYIFSPNIRLLNLFASVVGILFFSMWVLIDTQIIIGGYIHQTAANEYVFSALTLYIDIIMLFMMLLGVFSRFVRRRR